MLEVLRVREGTRIWDRPAAGPVEGPDGAREGERPVEDGEGRFSEEGNLKPPSCAGGAGVGSGNSVLAGKGAAPGLSIMVTGPAADCETEKYSESNLSSLRTFPLRSHF